MYGNIKWYKKHKQYGYIIGADEELYFFKLENCIDKYDDFEPDENVKFIPNWGNMDYATEVEKVGDFNEEK